MAAGASDKIRVLVVEDDAMYRLVLTKTFAQIANVELVGAVSSLTDAKTHLERGAIDLVTVDIVLQNESGIDLLSWMLRHAPRVLSVVLTAGSRRDASLAVDALLLGASTLVMKPQGANAEADLMTALRRIVQGARDEGAPRGITRTTVAHAARREVLAIGASTGGPVGLVRLLRGLPTTFTTPILVVQHMPSVHVPFFADMLARDVQRPVHVAEHGATLEPGHMYVAGRARHMQLERRNAALTLVLTEAPEENFCRPAVDPLFRSVAEVCGAAAVAVVLSGMGLDGAKGAQRLRSVGVPVLVQDRATSVVWGMPGAVVGMQAATEVVPIDAMADAVLRWVEAR